VSFNDFTQFRLFDVENKVLIGIADIPEDISTVKHIDAETKSVDTKEVDAKGASTNEGNNENRKNSLNAGSIAGVSFATFASVFTQDDFALIKLDS
jgi:hypothetical protein